MWVWKPVMVLGRPACPTTSTACPTRTATLSGFRFSSRVISIRGCTQGKANAPSRLRSCPHGPSQLSTAPEGWDKVVLSLGRQGCHNITLSRLSACTRVSQNVPGGTHLQGWDEVVEAVVVAAQQDSLHVQAAVEEGHQPCQPHPAQQPNEAGTPPRLLVAGTHCTRQRRWKQTPPNKQTQIQVAGAGFTDLRELWRSQRQGEQQRQ